MANIVLGCFLQFYDGYILFTKRGISLIEIRFHGRGGQGAVIASRILASAFFKEGKYVQAFSAFGSERRGAPVEAFVRIDNNEIKLRYMIYQPDHIVILDPALIELVDVRFGLKKNGWIIINSDNDPQDFKLFSDYRVATVDANSIAIKYRLGSKTAPIVNTAILGAFSKATRTVNINRVIESVKESIPAKRKENASATLEAYKKVKISKG